MVSLEFAPRYKREARLFVWSIYPYLDIKNLASNISNTEPYSNY